MDVSINNGYFRIHSDIFYNDSRYLYSYIKYLITLFKIIWLLFIVVHGGPRIIS